MTGNVLTLQGKIWRLCGSSVACEPEELAALLVVQPASTQQKPKGRSLTTQGRHCDRRNRWLVMPWVSSQGWHPRCFTAFAHFAAHSMAQFQTNECSLTGITGVKRTKHQPVISASEKCSEDEPFMDASKARKVGMQADLTGRHSVLQLETYRR